MKGNSIKTLEQMSNSFIDVPLYDRLINSNAIDLRNNKEVIDLNNGYSIVKPLDEKIRYK